jgi:5-methylcytosine-specific restriction endonuclease McrA
MGILDDDINKMLWGKKLVKRKKTTKKTTKKKEIKRHIFTADFNHLMDTQKGKCANKNCAKYHGVRQQVTTIKDIDHKFPIKLWELQEKKGDPNARSNLQLLCTGCHRRKTAEDRKKIAKYKEEHGIKTTRTSTTPKPPKPKMVTVRDALGRRIRVPISKTKVITGFSGRKIRVLKDFPYRL